MEVHHHAHTARKKILHYFWEFLMLFLAVFCGFMAEYQLEHKIEKEKEKQYINSLVQDLAYDTTQYQRTITRLNKKFPFYDSALHFLAHPVIYHDNFPFRFYIKTNIEHIYIPIAPTIQQLKNSGNLRLIRKKLVLDSILIYHSNITGMLQNQTDYVLEYNKRLVLDQEKVVDFSGLNQYLNGIVSGELSDDDSAYALSLLTNDKDKLKVLSNLFIGTKGSEMFYINILGIMKGNATALMLFIKKEYHLK